MSNVKGIDRQTFLNRAKEMFGNDVEYVTFGDVENIIESFGMKFSSQSYDWLNRFFDKESNANNELNVFVAPEDETVALFVLNDSINNFLVTLNE